MKKQIPQDKDPLKISQYAIYSAILWSLVILILLSWNLKTLEEEALNRAYTYTKIGFDKDVLYRRWASEHGGVYVMVTEKTPPNKYLKHIKNRDVFIDSTLYTLMNPAYMTRQLYELQDFNSDVKGHITSLKPIRPENKADAWETKVLQLFENGTKEFYEIDTLNGKDYLRYMKPFFVEQSCLKCHEEQGYKINEIRGGISVSYPMDQIKSLSPNKNRNHILQYIFIWILGIGIIILAYYRLKKSDNKRLVAENNLVKLNLDLEDKVEIRSKELINSEQNFLELIKSAPDGIIQVDSKGFIKYINEQVEKLFGYNKEELLGETIEKLIAVDLRDAHKKYREKHISDPSAKPMAQNIEVLAIRKDGSQFQADISISAVKIDNEYRVTAMIRDITERIRIESTLKESEETFRLAINATEDGIWDWNISTNEEYCSPRWCEIIGYSYDDPEFIHSYDSWASRIHPDDKDLVIKSLSNHLEKEVTYDVEYRHLHKSGEYRWQKSIGKAQFDQNKKPIRMVGCIRDITERKRIEEEIEKHRSHLEELVKERTTELESKNAELERMNKLFVDRELRMIELKEQLAALEKNKDNN